MRHHTTILFAIAFLTTLCSCQREQTIEANNFGQSCTLAYYKNVVRDTAKYAAARFLIENMPYHYSCARIYRDNDTLRQWLRQTDDTYYDIVRACKIDSFPWDYLRKVQQEQRDRMEADTLPDPAVDYRHLCDAEELGFRFLTEHIDNAFRVWRESPFAHRVYLKQG